MLLPSLSIWHCSLVAAGLDAGEHPSCAASPAAAAHRHHPCWVIGRVIWLRGRGRSTAWRVGVCSLRGTQLGRRGGIPNLEVR